MNLWPYKTLLLLIKELQIYLKRAKNQKKILFSIYMTKESHPKADQRKRTLLKLTNCGITIQSKYKKFSRRRGSQKRRVRALIRQGNNIHLKLPGKRNYKSLYANLQAVSLTELKQSSSMFKCISEDYYKLKIAERNVHKALREKGLFLDQKDFNIMELFNNAYSEYSFDEEEENKEPKPVRKFSSISVDNLDCSLPVKRPDHLASSGNPYSKPIGITNPFGRSSVGKDFLEVPSFSNSATPNSFTLEKMSLYSRFTNKTHQSFASKNSQRLLFQDATLERRQKDPKKAKGDFLCTCNHGHGQENYYPGIEIYPYRPYALLDIESDSDDDSILRENELVRSVSAPLHEIHEPEEKLMEPLPLERQPFSNMMNLYRPCHNYADPLEKIDLKKALRIENN